MSQRDHPRRSAGTGPGSNRPGSTRPKQAPRPEHPSPPPSSSSAGSPDIHLRPATFVDLSADQERHAIEALAELLVPFLTGPHRVLANPSSDLITEPIVATRVAPICDP
jgi:hypothetical protein